ncbi:hypothetical protein GTQ43_34890 [Nostoc sp. KVJ3]|uniref:hypothetical protein n=1 Tax=Nostoc sp. KVJ3 TaxID=457945 RepID=UPI00223729DE|nr:hypothetical protein [Nostoc sp. KVJ3]MCW5318681.1 hypothetical protein [Nostoc sp. KVJ3]
MSFQACSNISELLEELARLEARERELRAIEERFVLTQDASVLQEFTSSEPIRKVELANDHFERPVALLPESKIPPEAMAEWEQVLKRFLPDVKTERVFSMEGESYLAFVGITGATLSVIT